MHAEARAFVAAQLAGREPGELVVEVGGRNINGGVRDLLADPAGYVALDLQDGPGVDVVADAREWTPAELVDLVLCCEVLEHSDDVDGLVAAMAGYLRAGGALLVTCAAPERAPHSAHDGGRLRDGEHYAGVHPADLHEALTTSGLRVDVLEHHRDRGDLYAVAVRA